MTQSTSAPPTVEKSAAGDITVPPSTGRKKIAVLGGGLGSMTTVYALTQEKDWQERYDITVYQIGWRLGGKGASGRGVNDRIQEHGLHIWMGFYENAFRMMRDVFAEWNLLPRKPNWPIFPETPEADSAFKKCSYVGVERQIGDTRWQNWFLDFPENDLLPGDRDSHITSGEYLKEIIQFVGRHIRTTSKNEAADPYSLAPDPTIRHLLWDIRNVIQLFLLTSCVQIPHTLIDLIRHRRDRLPRYTGLEHTHSPIAPLKYKEKQFPCKQLAHLANWAHERLYKIRKTRGQEVSDLAIIMELAFIFIRGIYCDGLFRKPHDLDTIDNYDFIEWLVDHGASTDAAESAVIKGVYDLVFAYHNGDPYCDETPGLAKKSARSTRCLAAGAALRSILRIDLTYRGAIFWKMQASMGDTIFTPLYEVLRARGVKFEFFTQVDKLRLSADKRSIISIDMTRQVHLKRRQEGGTAEPIASIPNTPEEQERTDYYPLKPVGELYCWPDRPLFDQLVEGEQIKAWYDDPAVDPDRYLNLESAWATLNKLSPETFSLQQGQDFDLVVLGIAIGAHKTVCSELLEDSQRWRDMVDHVQTVNTVGMQVWMNRDLQELGWNLPSPVVDAYVQPWNTWADMTYLLPKESWPADSGVKNIAYFCGPLPDFDVDHSNPQQPAEIYDGIRESGQVWLNNSAAYFWPNSVPIGRAKGFDDSILVTTQANVAPYDAQYWSANIDPSERYVLSLAGSTKYRMRPDESGYANLYLAGDWTHNGLNIGCVEATAMSGLLCGNGVLRYFGCETLPIFGENFS
ncbi:MAG: dependent oxidoreductase [Chthonomonadaceae bacterium]|nr:dependent oxidoreductase [Chthonomonadaceae bacterium]